MSKFNLGPVRPKVPSSVYLAPSSIVVGNVTMGENVSVWFNAVIRGDVDKIIIGENTNVQDLVMLHVSSGFPLIIGANVSIGHNAVLHGCKVADSCLIGMGAILLDGCIIGRNSVVAAGAIVPPGKEYPEKSLIMGNPAKVHRMLNDEEVQKYGNHYLSYIKTKLEYQSKLAKWDL